MASSHSEAEATLKAGPSSSSAVSLPGVIGKELTDEPKADLSTANNGSDSKASSALKAGESTSSGSAIHTDQSQVKAIKENFSPSSRPPPPPESDYKQDEDPNEDQNEDHQDSLSSSSSPSSSAEASSPPSPPPPATTAPAHQRPRPRHFTSNFEAQNLFFRLLRGSYSSHKPFGLMRYLHQDIIMEKLPETVQQETAAGNVSIARALAAIFPDPVDSIPANNLLSDLTEAALFSKWENLFKLDRLNTTLAKWDFPLSESVPPKPTFRAWTAYSVAAKVSQFSKKDLASFTQVLATGRKAASTEKSEKISDVSIKPDCKKERLQATLRCLAEMKPSLIEQQLSDEVEENLPRSNAQSPESETEKVEAEVQQPSKRGRKPKVKVVPAVMEEQSEDSDLEVVVVLEEEEEVKDDEEEEEEEEEEQVEKPAVRPANLKGGRASLKTATLPVTVQKQTPAPVGRPRGGGGGRGRKPRATPQSKAAAAAQAEESSDEGSGGSSTPNTPASSGRGANRGGGSRSRRQSSNSDTKSETPATITTTAAATRKNSRSSRFSSNVAISQPTDESESESMDSTSASESQPRAASSMTNRSLSSTPARSGRGGRGGGGGHQTSASSLSASNTGIMIKSKLRHRMSTPTSSSSSTPTSAGTHFSGRGKRGGGGGATSTVFTALSRGALPHQKGEEDCQFKEEESVPLGKEGVAGAGRGAHLKKRKLSKDNSIV